jgi:hypothetical protein
VLIVASVTPILIFLFSGQHHSLSKSWGTPLEPLFIFNNAITSYYLYSSDRWKVSSVLLLAITALSVNSYPVCHNVIALLFFMSAGWSMFRSSRSFPFLVVYLIGSIFLPIQMFLGETLMIYSMVLYHFYVWMIVYKILPK